MDNADAGNSRAARDYETFHRRKLPHFEPLDRPVFITFCTKSRWVLPEPARSLVLRHCVHDHTVRLWLHVAVVMPDHVHLLLTPLADNDGTPYGLTELLSGIKGASSHSVNRLLGRRGAVWQSEWMDRVLRRDESVRLVAEYIAANPVRRGLAEGCDSYPWLWREWVDCPE